MEADLDARAEDDPARGRIDVLHDIGRLTVIEEETRREAVEPMLRRPDGPIVDLQIEWQYAS